MVWHGNVGALVHAFLHVERNAFAEASSSRRLSVLRKDSTAQEKLTNLAQWMYCVYIGYSHTYILQKKSKKKRFKNKKNLKNWSVTRCCYGFNMFNCVQQCPTKHLSPETKQQASSGPVSLASWATWTVAPPAAQTSQARPKATLISLIFKESWRSDVNSRRGHNRFINLNTELSKKNQTCSIWLY